MNNSAYVALGSNLGDSQGNLRRAAQYLKAMSVGPVIASSIWSSSAEGFSAEVDAFCNAVVQLESDLSPEALLQQLLRIEQQMGRQRRAAGGTYESRVIDLDLIDVSGQIMRTADLQLPHPRAHERRFVLLPLREIAPGFLFPDRADALDRLIEEAPDNPMQSLGPLFS